MSVKHIIACIIAVSACASAACESAKSANPLSPDLAGPLPGVEITAPKTLEPGVGQQILASTDPLALLIENAGTNGPRSLFLQVDVAADGGFQQILHQATRIEPGPDGRTSYRLPEPLGAGHTYYWRARALDGANTGPYSSTAHFSVINPVVLEPPTPLEPVGSISTNRPNFIVRNGVVSGPAGPIVYRLEIGTSVTAPPAAVVSATPGAGGTTTLSLGDLPFDRTLYWRVYATDGAVDSPYSGIVSFRTPPSPTPGPAPGPLPGGSSGTPLPGGSGGRTPDPSPGQRLPLPDMYHVVQAVAAARPNALRNSCQDHGGTWEFMDTLVRTLRTYDTRWGYNCKRGNCGDVSHDVVDFHWGRGNSEGSNEVYTIDVIAGHCGSNPGPAWINTQPDGGPGVSRWTCAGKC